MRRTIIYIAATCFLFSSIMFASRAAIAQEKVKLMMDTYKGPTVTISGKITFPGYKEGQRIGINVRRSPTKGPPDIASVNISQPGDYSLKVPQDIGNVYISVVVFQPKELSPGKDNPGRAYGKNPLRVEHSDIKEINIEIGGKLMMDTYKGPTVTISGKITLSGYKEGQRIIVNAKSSPTEGPPDIASVYISQPGEYSLKVPRNAGKIYIAAVVLEPGEKGPTKSSLRLKYDEGSPIKVEASDISGINISI